MNKSNHGVVVAAAGLCWALLAAGTVQAESALPAELLERAAALRDDARADNRAYEWIRSLTQDVGPRLAGSEGDRAAIAWALTTLNDLGFEQVRAEDITVPWWERGETRVRMISPLNLELVAETLGGSVGTPRQGLEAPVLRVRDVAALRALSPADVTGNIVFFSQRMRRTRDVEGYIEAVGNRVNGPAEAAAMGAVGVVIRSVSTADHRLAHTGTTRYRERGRRIPAFALSNPDADLLEHHLDAGQPVSLHLYSSARRLGTTRTANVIGEIPGTDLADEIIVLGAHLDSWDLSPGALDDASGVGIVLETARLLAAAGPLRRTLRVVLFGNEEFGLDGARDYARRHEGALERHVAAMEADLGADRVWRFDTRVIEDQLPLVDAIMDVLEPLQVERGHNDAYGGPDLGPMRERGVPIISLQQDATRYFDYHHSPSDTLDKVDRSQLNQVVAAWVATVWVLANMDEALAPVVTDTEPGEEDYDG